MPTIGKTFEAAAGSGCAADAGDDEGLPSGPGCARSPEAAVNGPLDAGCACSADVDDALRLSGPAFGCSAVGDADGSSPKADRDAFALCACLAGGLFFLELFITGPPPGRRKRKLGAAQIRIAHPRQGAPRCLFGARHGVPWRGFEPCRKARQVVTTADCFFC